MLRKAYRSLVVMAAADPDSFQLMPADGKATYRITHGAANSSFVDLPVIK
jgi:uncharacterized protein